MVELLLTGERKTGQHEGRGNTSALSDYSIIKPPDPPSLSAIGRFEITSHDVWKRQTSIASDVEEYATSLGIELNASFTDITISFGRQKSVHTGMFSADKCAVVGYVDTSTISSHVVGGKLQYLHSQLGIGNRILNLLEDCPLEIATPRQVMDSVRTMLIGDSGHSDGKFEDLYPPWVCDEDEWLLIDKEKTPDELSRLMDACDAVDYTASCCEMEDVRYLPYAVLLWHDLDPYWNKWASQNFYNYRMGNNDQRGTNPYWMIQQSEAGAAMECGHILAGHTPVHSEAELKEIITKSKPYLDLLNYITHEKKRIAMDYNYGV
jgi:hypothetical protein